MRTQAICLALALVLICPFASAQWVHTSLPDSDRVNCFAVSGTNLFAGTSHGVFLSSNNGTTWTAVNTGLTNTSVSALAVSGLNLFGGTGSGVFLSTNNGTSWTAAGLKDTVVMCVASSGTNLFAAGVGIYLSTNGGTSWTVEHAGTAGELFRAFVFSGINIFAGSYPSGLLSYVGRLLLSTNNGTSWTPVWVDTSLTLKYAVLSLTVSGANLFAGTGSGVFLSTNNGTSWAAVDSGLPNTYVDALALSGTNLFAGSDAGVFLSTNNGTSWIGVNSGLPNTYFYSLAVSGMNLFAGTNDGAWRRPLSEMIATSVEKPITDLPKRYSLDQNYPNPFNPSTTITYELPRASHVDLSVFDILGRQVSVLVNERRDGGVHDVKFDGAGLASGLYSTIDCKREILFRPGNF